ncbi:hypothetical protein PIB30_007227 [Stylosanthes scabra]|uniref:Uncharacterized protein n=1 Tax=Stylosanthes scabra TaxID=79078 RepID=A0ABU6V3C2_9FABA|nr:hypothetical protein [Stylosanthes scabra]
MNNDAMIRSDDEEFAEADQDEKKSEDPLDNFSLLYQKQNAQTNCKKINKFLEYNKDGKSLNPEVRKRKNYQNPDFLLHAVRFDPYGYDSSDFYDEIDVYLQTG